MYPIAALLILVEMRAPLRAFLAEVSLRLRWLAISWLLLIWVGATTSVVNCIEAVSADEALHGFSVWYVSFSGILLGVTVPAVVGISLSRFLDNDPA
ncbi:hypothetical protein DEI92_04985 [Curtobacterium sp. MCBD17_034]|nr:hypothetical protein DEI92_04985 [Curtobacterium sp. MCBD17_034]PZM40328.1 hypothetical protein DEI90_01220 [Curtobacterium sp. MCBD17_031]